MEDCTEAFISGVSFMPDRVELGKANANRHTLPETPSPSQLPSNESTIFNS